MGSVWTWIYSLCRNIEKRKSENYLYYLIPPNNDILEKELIIKKDKIKLLENSLVELKTNYLKHN